MFTIISRVFRREKTEDGKDKIIAKLECQFDNVGKDILGYAAYDFVGKEVARMVAESLAPSVKEQLLREPGFTILQNEIRLLLAKRFLAKED